MQNWTTISCTIGVLAPRFKDDDDDDDDDDDVIFERSLVIFIKVPLRK